VHLVGCTIATDSRTLLRESSKSRRLTQLEQSRNPAPPHGTMDR